MTRSLKKNYFIVNCLLKKINKLNTKKSHLKSLNYLILIRNFTIAKQ